jgi:hypothetical protein
MSQKKIPVQEQGDPGTSVENGNAVPDDEPSPPTNWTQRVKDWLHDERALLIALGLVLASTTALAFAQLKTEFLAAAVLSLAYFAVIGNAAVAVRVTRGQVTVWGYIGRGALLWICSGFCVWAPYVRTFDNPGDYYSTTFVTILAVVPYGLGWLFFHRAKARWAKSLRQ